MRRDTEAWLRSLEADTELEEVEYAALSNAGVLALVLTHDVPRLVVAAEVPEDQVRDLSQPHGEVEVERLGLGSGAGAVRRRTGAVQAVSLRERGGDGESLATALAAPEVAAMLDDRDLLWFAPDGAGSTSSERSGTGRWSGSSSKLSEASGRLGTCLAQSGRARSPSAWSRFR